MPKIGVGIYYGRYLWGARLVGAEAPVAFGTAGRVYLSPVEVPCPVVIDRLAYQVGAGSNGNVRLGLYREGATPDSPLGGALVIETASVAQDTAQTVQFVTVADTLLIPGLYFLAIQGDDVTGSRHYGYHTATGIAFYYDRAGGYGAFTDPCPSLTNFTAVALGGLRVKTNLPLGSQM